MSSRQLPTRIEYWRTRRGHPWSLAGLVLSTEYGRAQLMDARNSGRGREYVCELCGKCVGGTVYVIVFNRHPYRLGQEIRKRYHYKCTPFKTELR